MRAFCLLGAISCTLFVYHYGAAQSQVKHKVHSVDLSREANRVSKFQTIDPSFTAAAPNGFPRSGVAGFELDYEIVFTADNATENIDYFAFSAPSGWTITAIGPAPPQTACSGTPHTAVISGFSASSAYWGGDYGGGVVTPGSPGTYPDIDNRSGCGPFATALTPAAADTHMFSVTMTPSATGQCPGTETSALPLCCSASEVSAGGPPPAGSEPYFNEMIAASDTNASVFGDAFYYVSLQCPPPFVDLRKYPLDATVNSVDCLNAQFSAPDTLTILSPPADSAQFCYATTNISDIFADPWVQTTCDSVSVQDDVLGSVVETNFVLQAGHTLVQASQDSVEAPAIDSCVQNIGTATCTTPAGSDYIPGVGVQTGQRLTSVPNALDVGEGIDSAWVCTVADLPVELSHFGVKSDDGDLLLEWTTASETNNSGFTIEHRLADDAAFRDVGYVPGAGTSFETRSYTFRVPDPGPGRHVVRLKQVDFDGAFTYSPQLLTQIEVPGDYFLTAAYPNPFSASATVEFAVPASQKVRLELVDIQGRPVRVLYDGRLEANARRKARIDAAGLASGTYFVRMSGERFQSSEMVTLAK